MTGWCGIVRRVTTGGRWLRVSARTVNGANRRHPVAEIKMETQCLHHNHPGTQVIAAYVKAREGPSDWWYFSILCDEEA